MTKARDLANAGTALTSVSATELGYVDGVTSAIQTQIDSKIGQATAINPTIVDAKGDLITATAADTPARLAVGTNGQVLTADSTASTGLKWATPSSGTVSFTWRATTAGNSLRSIEYNGSNLYVAAGLSGALYTSTDGTTWTSRTSGFGSNSILKVAYGNGLWVAVGQNGTITTSTDGTTWTARTSNMSTNTIRDVKYANSVWVAVGDGGGTTNTGGITYSTDGITWTRKSQSLTVGTQYNCVVYNGTNWIVGASVSTNNYLYASTPSGTWTAGADGSGQAVSNIFWDGTRNLVNIAGYIRFSTSTTLGTTTQLLGVEPRSSVQMNYYYNGTWYTLGAYVNSISTTPQTGDYGRRNQTILSPIAYDDSNGTATSQAGALWVGAAGYIVSSDPGSIWTSF